MDNLTRYSRIDSVPCDPTLTMALSRILIMEICFKERKGFLTFIYTYPFWIHGAAIYGAPWIPSTKAPLMLAFLIPAPWILSDISWVC